MAAAPITVGPPPPLDLAFLLATDAFDASLAQVPERGWDGASPCAGWSVRDVVGHIIGTMVEVAAIVGGESFSRDDSTPGDAAGDDPLGAFRAVSGPARDAVRHGDLDRTTDAIHGRRTVAEALAFPTTDLVVHAWDVCHATGQDLRLSAELLAYVLHTALQVPEDVLRRPGLFGPARPVAPDADDTTRLMGWLGRETAR